MQYIHLNDDSYVLRTSKGMTTINRKTFNFHKIKTLINKGVEEVEVLPLLETPSMPDGIFELYLHQDTDTMLIKHILKDGVQLEWSRLNNKDAYCDDEDSNRKFIGIYVSEQDIMEEWPEYLL